MAFTKYLRIVVDEDLIDPDIIDALKRIGALRVKTLFECDCPSGTKDRALIAKAGTKDRLLLTANYNDINERRYKPCTHGGIIIIDHDRPSAQIVYKRVRAFCDSGRKAQAKGHVTWLKQDKFTIHKLDKVTVEEGY